MLSAKSQTDKNLATIQVTWLPCTRMNERWERDLKWQEILERNNVFTKCHPLEMLSSMIPSFPWDDV